MTTDNPDLPETARLRQSLGPSRSASAPRVVLALVLLVLIVPVAIAVIMAV